MRLAGTEGSASITLDLEGEPIPAREGEPVACALLAAGETLLARSVKYHRPRGPFCFQGSCSQCLMQVDGLPNLPTCRIAARPGMKLCRQNAFPSAEVDVFSAIDWLFPRGLDHHQMFAGVPIAQAVMAKVARHLAGLGKLPSPSLRPRLPAQTREVTVAVVGGGAAGGTAAKALLEKRVEMAVVEREGEIGGRLLSGAPEPDAPTPPDLPPDVVLTRSTAIGLFDDERGRYLAVVRDAEDGPQLLRLYAKAFILANGGYPQLLPFENNDLPGVFSGRMVSALIRRHQLLPGRQFVLVGDGPELHPLAQLISEHGGDLVKVLPLSAHSRILGAHGRRSVSSATLEIDGQRERHRCDALVLSVPPSPAFELARQGGAEVHFSKERGAFVVSASLVGRTQAPGVFAAGELLGLASARACAESGWAVGEEVARGAR